MSAHKSVRRVLKNLKTLFYSPDFSRPQLQHDTFHQRLNPRQILDRSMVFSYLLPLFHDTNSRRVSYWNTQISQERMLDFTWFTWNWHLIFTWAMDNLRIHIDHVNDSIVFVLDVWEHTFSDVIFAIFFVIHFCNKKSERSYLQKITFFSASMLSMNRLN